MTAVTQRLKPEVYPRVDDEATIAAEAAPAGGKNKGGDPATGENLASLLKIDELTLEIGFQLIPLVDEKQGGQMLNRATADAAVPRVRVVSPTASAPTQEILLPGTSTTATVQVEHEA